MVNNFSKTKFQQAQPPTRSLSLSKGFEAFLEQKEAGFTIIELVVIITIFAIMSSILLFNFKGFNKNIERNNLAQDIALLIRKTQSYGVSSSTINGGILTDTTTLPSRYGLLFLYNAQKQSVQTIMMYKKVGGSNVSVGYTQLTDILVDTISVASPGVSIMVCTSTNASTCGTPIQNNVAIEFERPKPDPYASASVGLPFVIRLMPLDTLVPWYIVVTPTGSIYVKR